MADYLTWLYEAKMKTEPIFEFLYLDIIVGAFSGGTRTVSGRQINQVDCETAHLRRFQQIHHVRARQTQAVDNDEGKVAIVQVPLEHFD